MENDDLSGYLIIITLKTKGRYSINFFLFELKLVTVVLIVK